MSNFDVFEDEITDRLSQAIDGTSVVIRCNYAYPGHPMNTDVAAMSASRLCFEQTKRQARLRHFCSLASRNSYISRNIKVKRKDVLLKRVGCQKQYQTPARQHDDEVWLWSLLKFLSNQNRLTACGWNRMSSTLCNGRTCWLDLRIELNHSI